MWRCSRRLQKLVTYENLTTGQSFPRWSPDRYIYVLYPLLEENYVTQFLNYDNCRSMLTPNVRIIQKAYCIHLTRLQNSPYFCVFKYARAVKQRSGTRLKTESDTGVWGSRASRAQDPYAKLYRFLYWFWEKNGMFCSLTCNVKIKPLNCRKVTPNSFRGHLQEQVVYKRFKP